jgi:hypothetical protein
VYNVQLNHYFLHSCFIEFTPCLLSMYTGKLDVVNEVAPIIKVLLALSNEAKMFTHDPCEVWRKVDCIFQVTFNVHLRATLVTLIGCSTSSILVTNKIILICSLYFQYRLPSRTKPASPLILA